jgi:hypothetical protein
MIDELLNTALDCPQRWRELDPNVRAEAEARVRQRRKDRANPLAREAYFDALLNSILQRLDAA